MLVHDLSFEDFRYETICDAYEQQEKAAVPNLQKPKIGKEGQLLEYGEDFEEEDIFHRHLSLQSSLP